MLTTTWNNMRLSRMMLGTVQFGLPYGVANNTGQPTYREALQILAAAIEAGVNCFDTAAAYGTSEEVLGRALAELRVADQVIVVTKVPALSAEETSDVRRARRHIEDSIVCSRQRLRIDCLPIVLLHRDSDAAHLETLADLRERGWLKHLGVSCGHDANRATQLLESTRSEALQLPANILDGRHLQSGVLQRAAERHVAVFLRSVFLQGLLLMPEERIPHALHDVIAVRRQLTDVARGAGMELAELAFRFLWSQDHVTCVLIGVETVEQLRSNLAICQRGPLDQQLMSAIGAVTTQVPERVITPSMWSG